ncbi:MAG: glycosyltransferase family 2 protein [Actinobacteria bacterium]|nr:glycosyltransferase family 2 protein [Actinomycetota bacterium]
MSAIREDSGEAVRRNVHDQPGLNPLPFGLDALTVWDDAEATAAHGAAVVDVGIPTIGTSPYLAESIESVLAQTLTSWRLTVSENGPGLESVRRTMEPYLGDPRVRHIVTGVRVGRGANHTIAVRSGKAPYVGVLHDDDQWHPQFLERRVAFIGANPSCGLAFGGYVVIDTSGKPVGRRRLPLREGVHRSASVLPRLYRDMFIGPPTVLVRRTAYEAVGSEYVELVNTDFPMWVRLAANFDIGCLTVWDADYRHHPSQTSADRVQFTQWYFPAFDAVADLPISRSLRRLVRAEAHVRCALDAIERAERRESLRHLAKAVRTDPLCLVRPTVAARILAGIAALATGARGRQVLTKRRERRWHTGGAEGLLPAMPEDFWRPSATLRSGALPLTDPGRSDGVQRGEALP